MNLIEKAESIVLFKESIANECKKLNMPMPTNEQISDYIDGGYSMSLEDFMHDYTHSEGIFRH